MHSPKIPADLPATGPIKLPCLCGKTLTVLAHLAGKKIRCPDCERVLFVPAPAESKAADATIVPDQTLPHPSTAISAAPAPAPPAPAAKPGPAAAAIVLPPSEISPSELSEDELADAPLSRSNRLAMFSVAVLTFCLALVWILFIRGSKPLSTDADVVLAAAYANAGLPKTFKSSFAMDFVLVPKGKFLMGGYAGIPGGDEVVIPHDFYLGTYEVTQDEWKTVMGDNPSAYSPFGLERHMVPAADFKRFPVEKVNWEDCQAFIKKLNALDPIGGWTYRLPMEAEWEYACRGGPSKNNLDFGFDYYFERPTNTLSKEKANYFVAGGNGRPCMVGSYPPNRLGLYDMHGNVVEWCEDRAMGASQHTRRGGAFTRLPEHCRAASRVLHAPTELRADQGLRVARVPTGK